MVSAFTLWAPILLSAALACWGATGRNMFDGLVYGLLTGGAFGWLCP